MITSSASEIAPRVQWRLWSARIATAVIVPLLLLGIVEGTLRLCQVGFPSAVTVPCTIKGSPAACDNLFFTSAFFPPRMIRLPRPYAIPAEKSPNTFRVFVLGESTAFGDPEPTYGFSRYLEVMLRERFPNRNFEIVNTGVTAINSHVVLPIAKGLAGQRGDLFIIYTGNNEVVGPYGPGTVLTSSTFGLPAIRASIFLRSTRIGQLIMKAVSPADSKAPQQWGGMEMFLNQQVRATSPALARAYENFGSNLEDTVSVARKSGARVMVSTIATNLKDCAPFASLHREGLSKAQLDSWTTLVQQGDEQETRGSYEQALKFYRSALEIDPEYAELEFRIARCLWKLEQFTDAKQHFTHAQDLDTLRFRADTRINNQIRSVAARAGAGVELVDSEDELSRQSAHGIAGSELLWEHVHLTPRGNYLVARAMFLRIAKMLATDSAASASIEAPSIEECNRDIALTSYDKARVASDMLQRLQKAPFTHQLNNQEQLAELTRLTDAPVATDSEIADEYRMAIARYPDDKLLHLNFGFFLYDRNPRAAVEQLKMAQPYDKVPLARYGR